LNRQGSAAAVRVWLGIALAWLVAGPVQAAAAGKPQPQPQSQSEADELDEVLVEGNRLRAARPGFKQYEQSFGWLARMVGSYVVEGTVDLHAAGRSEDLRKASGRLECVGFGSAPGVQCELRVRWVDATGKDGEALAGVATSLNPAALLFGVELVHSGISYMLVDSQGYAETTVGEMTSADTMQSRATCGAIAGNCERVSRITASPDLKTLDMKMDLLIDRQKAVSFALVMRRASGSPAVVYGRKEKGRK
jgi:hypothetical protein